MTVSGTGEEGRLDYDPSIWVEVPIVFRESDVAIANEWASEFAREATASDGREGTRREIEALAREAVAMEHPAATRRFWHFPETGGEHFVAHAFSAPREAGESPVDQLLGLPGKRETVAPVELGEIDGERVVRVAFSAPLPEADTDQGRDERDTVPLALCVRIARCRSDSLSVLEVVDPNVVAVSLGLENLDKLAFSLISPERPIS